MRVSQLLANELVRRGLLTPETAAGFIVQAQEENKFLGKLLIDNNIISDADLLKIKSELYQLPVVNLEAMPLNKAVLKEIPEDVVSFYHIVPFARDDTTMHVGIINPEDIDALEALKFIASDKGLQLKKYVISYKDYDNIVVEYGSLSREVGKALKSITESDLGDIGREKELKLDQITAESPVTKIVGAMLKHAVELHASDIHIEPFENRVRARFRIDGSLATVLTLPKELHPAIATRIKILSDLKIDETRLAQDGRFSIKIGTKKVDFRVSTFPTKNGEKIVMRILDSQGATIGLEELGVEGKSLDMIKKAVAKPFGCVLITGPTGSGKSTTIASIINLINDESINIVTLEDPVEYFIDGVNQSQIHEEIGYTFAAGLRHILRQDPDVIMVGEIRDKETAKLAVQAALTGHIVLSTLHTNNAVAVIPRLIDMGVENYLIPPTINLTVAQRLLRRLCPTCKIEEKASATEEKMINDALATMPPEYQKQIFSKNGYMISKPNIKNPCKECGGKAYKGRIGVFEMLEMTDNFEKIILGTISEADLRQEAQRQGMITMFQDGIIKVLKGVVSMDELLEVAQSQEVS